MTTAVTIERSEREIAIEINLIKQRAARDLLSAAIDVGRLLCEAKEKVPYGEWGTWLQENVDYSVSNANNMMRLYQEKERAAQLDMFGTNDFSVFEGMNPSQVLALLPVPAAERRQFIEDNNAKEMSVREIKDAVKAREEAEARADAAEQRASDAESKVEDLSVRLESAETQIKLMDKMASPLSEEERKQIEKEAADKAKAAADKKIAAAQKKAEAELQKAKEEGAAAVKKVEEERDAAIKAATEEARAAAEKEAAAKLRELEDKLKARAVEQSPYLTRFKTLMETFQEDYKRMLGVIAEAEQQDPDTAAKLRTVLERITDSLKGA